MLSGRWTYRSYREEAALVGSDAEAALALIAGEGRLDFDPTGPDSFRGGLGMASGLALTLTGTVLHAGSDAEEFAVVGLGIEGTGTEGWRYDYRCSRGYHWPDGAGQLQSLVGTMVRVHAHGPDAPAGETGAFIAVEQREPAGGPERIYRRNVLTAQV